MDIILSINSITDIIPMKFLTIFTSEERVKDIIAENYEQFIHNLVITKDKKELSLKIYCDEKKYKAKIMKEEIKNFEDSLIGKPKGAAFFLRKKFEGELDNKIQNKICSMADRLIDEISCIAAEVKLNKLLDKEITGISTQMITNSAFLVDSKKQNLFFSKVSELKEDYESCGFIIELSGPWPPFSFCS